MFKRLLLFVITNVLIVLTISIVTSLLGLNYYMTRNGLDYNALLEFCLIWGMAGSFISLMISRWSAKMMMGVQVIDPNNPGSFGGYVAIVHDLAKRAGLTVMPEVGVFDSPELNAFATGPTKNRALVAASTGLLSAMNRDQIEGVIGHEITHITNGDMVTMALLQGVVNAFVMFLSRVIAFFLSQQAREENRFMVQYLVTMVLQMVIGLLGVMVVCWFSRKREFRADAGSAKLNGAGDMISALQVLENRYEIRDPRAGSQSIAPYKISGQASHASLFATHPPLEERIARLQQYA